MDSYVRCNRSWIEPKRSRFQIGYGGISRTSRAGGSLCQLSVIGAPARTRGCCPMLIQDCRSDNTIVGACADCGMMVPRRVAYVDRTTHATVELCNRCCCVAQQRQVFAGGCCE